MLTCLSEAIRANATSPTNSIGFGANFTNATLAEGDAIYRLLLSMDASRGPKQTDCGCMIFGTFEQGDKCTLSSPVCVYWPNATGVVNNHKPYFRSKAFNPVDSVVGVSAGFIDPTKGTPDVGTAVNQAVHEVVTGED